jgi:hypothetical protein
MWMWMRKDGRGEGECEERREMEDGRNETTGGAQSFVGDDLCSA